MSEAPEISRIFSALDATWPAQARHNIGAFHLREGRGGGSRVSAATLAGPWQAGDLCDAKMAMRAMGQSPLFMIRPGEDALDLDLDGRGYKLMDPTDLWICDIGVFGDCKLPPVTAFAIWEPLAIMHELWEEDGIGPARRAVMDRCAVTKTGLLGRVSDKPCGVGFAAIHDEIAMVHALSVRQAHRRKGLGAWMMRCAAFWAREHGARWLALAATRANGPAGALYSGLRMYRVGQYHYRVLDDRP